MNESNGGWLATYPCVRALLMLFNIVFWISGLMLVYIGIWLHTDFEIYLKINENYSEWTPYVLLIIGTIILFVSSLACSCIVKIQPTMLVIYGGFLITMLYTLISLSVYIYTYKDKLIAGIENSLGHEIKNHELYTNNESNSTTLDAIQRELRCCAYDSYLNWNGSELPRSCCFADENQNDCNVESKNLHKVGCASKLHHLINTNLTTVGVTTSAIALFPLFGTIFSFALAILGGNKSGYDRIA